MAKRCPETGEMKLYLDCMECEDRRYCGSTVKSRKEDEEKGTERRKEANRGYEAKTAHR